MNTKDMREKNPVVSVWISGGDALLFNEHGTLLRLTDDTPFKPEWVHHMKWNGERVGVVDGKFVNPEWSRDRRKPMYLTADEAGERVASRLETMSEVAERKLAAVLRELSSRNKKTSDAMAKAA